MSEIWGNVNLREQQVAGGNDALQLPVQRTAPAALTCQLSAQVIPIAPINCLEHLASSIEPLVLVAAFATWQSSVHAIALQPAPPSSLANAAVRAELSHAEAATGQ